jgi:hypothetical protein
VNYVFSAPTLTQIILANLVSWSSKSYRGWKLKHTVIEKNGSDVSKPCQLLSQTISNIEQEDGEMSEIFSSNPYALLNEIFSILKTCYNGHRVGPFAQSDTFPCLGIGCMNQPLVIYHNYTKLQGLIGLCLEEYFLWFCKTNLTALWPGKSESTKEIEVWTV